MRNVLWKPSEIIDVGERVIELRKTCLDLINEGAKLFDNLELEGERSDERSLVQNKALDTAAINAFINKQNQIIKQYLGLHL